ncbi:hypothetical protein [Cobetia sp. ICG0124]|uniref:hypothetical protein n=1 Tax=Cobetia sp. ICG0124 TaxID=2053669 RepID=UPI000FD85552|nr:hypothetical protein [Cobetia sp. ICG0124]
MANDMNSGEIRQCRQADTLTRRRVMSPENVEALPEMQALMRDRRFRRLMRYCSGHARQPIMHLERIHNGVLESHERDPQKSLHVDTFQPTMKFWLYLQDVNGTERHYSRGWFGYTAAPDHARRLQAVVAHL